MRYLPFKHFVAGMAVFVAGCVGALAQTPSLSGIGRAPTPEELAVLDKGAGPSGKDLPPGKGTAKQGAGIYAIKCAMCHGQNGEGITGAPSSQTFFKAARLGGGNATPKWQSGPRDPNAPPEIISGSFYFAFPTTIWNAIAVYMPQFRAGSLTPDEVYSLTAYVLFKNNIIKEEDVMDRETLPKVRLPNRDAFVPNRIEDLQDWDKRGCRLPYGVCP